MKTVLSLKPYTNGEERVPCESGLPTAQAVQMTGNILAKNEEAHSYGLATQFFTSTFSAISSLCFFPS